MACKQSVGQWDESSEVHNFERKLPMTLELLLWIFGMDRKETSQNRCVQPRVQYCWRRYSLTGDFRARICAYMSSLKVD